MNGGHAGARLSGIGGTGDTSGARMEYGSNGCDAHAEQAVELMERRTVLIS